MSKEIQVDHPDHYQAINLADPERTYETIKVIKSMGMLEHFCLGNSMKYIMRADRKGTKLKDLQKASWYLNYLINDMMDVKEAEVTFEEATEEFTSESAHEFIKYLKAEFNSQLCSYTLMPETMEQCDVVMSCLETSITNALLAFDLISKFEQFDKTKAELEQAERK